MDTLQYTPPEAISQKNEIKLNQQAKEMLAGIQSSTKIPDLDEVVSRIEVLQGRGDFILDVFTHLIQESEKKRREIQDNNTATFLLALQQIDTIHDLDHLDTTALEAQTQKLIRPDNYVEIKKQVELARLEIQNTNTDLLVTALLEKTTVSSLQESLPIVQEAVSEGIIRSPENTNTIEIATAEHIDKLQEKRYTKHFQAIENATTSQTLTQIQSQVTKDYQKQEISQEGYQKLLEKIRKHSVPKGT